MRLDLNLIQAQFELHLEANVEHDGGEDVGLIPEQACIQSDRLADVVRDGLHVEDELEREVRALDLLLQQDL